MSTNHPIMYSAIYSGGLIGRQFAYKQLSLDLESSAHKYTDSDVLDKAVISFKYIGATLLLPASEGMALWWCTGKNPINVKTSITVGVFTGAAQCYNAFNPRVSNDDTQTKTWEESLKSGIFHAIPYLTALTTAALLHQSIPRNTPTDVDMGIKNHFKIASAMCVVHMTSEAIMNAGYKLLAGEEGQYHHHDFSH